jgi:peptidoglycan/LPS O-acetylase OafA/YrhL
MTGAAVKYRRDIDGLRSLAILPVVANHLGVSDGGFVGVDVFFVISGYLITAIISQEMDAGTYSLAGFYRRRILRIVPALAVMLLVTLAVGYWVLLPTDFAQLGKSAAAAALSVSNILFWTESGYFDVEAKLKPLLHTWSLGVEEQFYLFFPLLLLLFPAAKPQVRRWGILSIVAASFALSVFQVATDHASDAFYLLPARGWELGLGALLALGVFPQIPDRLRNAASALGLALLCGSIVPLNARTPFPGLTALPPCLGALLIIAAGREDANPLVNRLLGLWPLVFIGQISYSLYLWHWPVLVFGQLGLDHWGKVEALGALIVMFALAIISWRFIEAPFRRASGVPTQKVLLFGAGGLVAISAVGLTVAAFGGWDARLSPTARRLEAALKYDEASSYDAGRCFLEGTDRFDEFGSDCLSRPSHVLLIGDSHAAHLLPGLRERFGEVRQATASGCRALIHQYRSGAALCARVLGQVFREDYRPADIDTIVLGGRWTEQNVKDIRQTAEFLGRRAREVVVIGPVPQYKQALPRLLIKAEAHGGAAYVEAHRDKSTDKVDLEMAQALQSLPHVRYVSALSHFCRADRCDTQDDDGAPLAWDYGHLTDEGSKSLVRAAFSEPIIVTSK